MDQAISQLSGGCGVRCGGGGGGGEVCVYVYMCVCVGAHACTDTHICCFSDYKNQ